MNRWLSLVVILFAAAPASGEVRFKEVVYKIGKTEHRGHLAIGRLQQEKVPGVLVVHEWWGLNDYAKRRAEELAEMGFVALAVDMYGEGRTTTDRKEAGALSTAVKKGNLMRPRVAAGYRVLAANPHVDPKRIAAIGFCFGGTAVLELAYSGADLAGVVSFHGGLTTPAPSDQLKARLLVLHGADDPFVPDEQVAAWEGAMRKAGADWQLIKYGGAVHAFTNPAAGNDKSQGAAYNALAAHRSWEHMRVFFDEIFATKPVEGTTKKN